MRDVMLTNLSSRRGPFLLFFVVLLMLSAGRAFASDEEIWAALKTGGKVVLMRHTHVDMREGLGHLAPGNCAEEVNLSPSGIEQAKRIGEAFRAHEVAVGEVLTSPYCRCIDTGTLAFGRATPVQFLRAPGTVSEDQATLNRQSVVQEILNHHGPSNLIMITHDLNIADLVLEDTVPMGEFFVVQPKATDFDIIGKIQLNNQ
jgi:phosphohistidine phosphatase SixA